MVSGAGSATESEGLAASGCGLEILAEEGASGCWARAMNGEAAESDSRIRQTTDRGWNARADKLHPVALAILKMNFNFIIPQYSGGEIGSVPNITSDCEFRHAVNQASNRIHKPGY